MRPQAFKIAWVLFFNIISFKYLTNILYLPRHFLKINEQTIVIQNVTPQKPPKLFKVSNFNAIIDINL